MVFVQNVFPDLMYTCYVIIIIQFCFLFIFGYVLIDESTRVHLYEKNDDPLSSYINANYVRVSC